ncbi:MAG: DHA2 family efflux MFS transporter permease subunit [Brevibacterium sp.]|uniref:DHA2 family efflux MFS transporter permease subunit n=1 Tax=Brevibacterium sp. TaxID=1701 RepID=UPI0026475332|nr:DHA2 family efflux MFS transporter permease subunit [Brevibacterium sp.]MDN5806325.1 DHA2 family efflux MFS transporter permease subunit [Brevibacterium sp.]MDN5833621.1 DHA2 family efflux MFS transporter permease subunit [Brevibacterium sp.]MDN5875627.1 DHA2 family efflux MFS transporter permease subunit [Brevibacterium sp.]MDN5909346.1 DHA2 family efflux MFS transporter permease subunit [Brevibacterium sp.]MDN6132553.1 DHA2 family efflux MFS transporter permease subunit [Brevibacterium sp
MRVIWLLLVAAFVAILNETTMAIAIPELNASLGIPPELGQWLTSAFMLTMAVVIPTTGFLLQRFTTRQIFLAAMILFSSGTLICLVAPGFAVLLVGRVVQAAGTGIMMPLLMTTMMNVVPPHSRGRMMGRVGLVISLAPAIGPTMSGIVLDSLGWRWLFAIVLPIALVALGLGAKWMTNLGESTHAPIDMVSVVLSVFAFGGIVFGLSQFGGGDGGGSANSAWTAIAAGLVFLALFVWRQLTLQKEDRALLDLRVFSAKNYVIAVVIMAVVSLAMFGTFSLLPLYLQNVAGLNATQSGLVLLPGSILMGVLAPVMGRIYDARGPRTLLIPGSVMIAASMFSYSMVGVGTPTWVLVVIQTVMSLGLAASFTPLFSASLGSLEPKLYSHGSAALNTMQQVAGAAGTALLISIYSSALHSGEAAGRSVAESGAPGAHNAFLLAAVIALVPVVLSFFIKKPEDQEDAPAEVVHSVTETPAE